MVQGRCRFCGVEGELCHSHVIPELCYLAAYDTKHRSTQFQAEPSARKLIQKGLREHLLCKKCEGKFSKWETAFKQFWYAKPAIPQQVTEDFLVVKGFDYKTFKLFHLSILWRASVASGPEFNTVALGADEEKIRKALEADDPGPEGHYPILGRLLLNDQREIVYGLVGKPQQAEIDGRQAYYASYAGVEWTIFVSTDSPSSEISGLFPIALRSNGEMFLGTVDVAQSNTIKIFGEQYHEVRGSVDADATSGEDT